MFLKTFEFYSNSFSFMFHVHLHSHFYGFFSFEQRKIDEPQFILKISKQFVFLNHFHSFIYQYCTFILVKFSRLYVHAAALPKPDDIQGIIVSMPGLQNVYNLTASQIAMGEYQGYNFGSLSGNEYSSFYFISSSCFFFCGGGVFGSCVLEFIKYEYYIFRNVGLP